MELDKSVGGLAGEGFERSTLWRALGRSVEMTGNGWLGGGAAVIWFGGRGVRAVYFEEGLGEVGSDDEAAAFCVASEWMFGSGVLWFIGGAS